MAVLLLCVLGVKGQTDYSGVYYFANYAGYNVNSSSTNWYMVPADGPIQPHYADAWFNNQYCNSSTGTGDYTGDNYGDPEQPFITTYKTNKDRASVPSGVIVRIDNSIWIVVSSGEAGYYYIIHATTGKYIVYEPPYKKATNRKSVHLLTTTSPGENAKFAIDNSGSGICIRPKSLTTGNRFLNPAGNNQQLYYGTGSDYFHSGMVGVWSDAGGNSIWYKEDTLCQAPSINHVPSEGNYTITWHGSTVAQLPSGYSIRYTTNGNNPTIDSPIYDGSIVVVTTDNTLVKAIVTGHGMVLSNMATQVVNTATPDAPTFEVTCDSKLQINCNISTARIYYNYTTDGTTPADPDNTSTEYTAPIIMPDNAKVKAVAYNGSNPVPSPVSAVYTVFNNTPSPTIDLYETYAVITFGTGETIHYTTDGSEPDPTDAGESTSPFTISGLSYNADVEIRVVATSTGRPMSCPVTVVKRPKQPTVDAVNECIGVFRIQTLALTDTEEGKTYWYALSNGAGQPVPALNTFTQYTPGSTIDIADIPAWNGTDIWVTLHAYAMTADGFVSHVVSEDYRLIFTDAPTITHSGNSVTITATSGATIRYSVDGGSQQTATTTTTFTVTEGQNHIITATAQLGSEGESCEAVHTIIIPTIITTLQQLNDMGVNGTYMLGNDITNAGSYTTKGTDANPFIGSFDGAGFTISGLTKPLFGTTNGAVIHDVNLKELQISEAGDVGAIVCDAKGYTRIYNCGILPTNADFSETTRSSVTSTGNGSAGGLVGKLEDDSRVVNCFSYADVSSTGYAAGIVGNNTFASTAEVVGGKYTKLRTMVVNCMFYGDITAGSNVWPVYGGEKIINGGGRGADISDGYFAINNYNFYSDSCSFPAGKEPSRTHIYNCSWPAKYEYLTRYEFHRYLLNSNRELCGWWVGASYAPSTMTTLAVRLVPKDATLMAKWVLDRSVAPFPILKPFGYYPSPINIDADAEWREEANEWEGKRLGTLSVTINPGVYPNNTSPGVSEKPDVSFFITDMDTIHADYCYRKIQLPYYNSVFGNPNGTTWETKYGGNYSEYVVTGWKITKVNGSNEGTGDFVADWQDGYNFADRNSTKKDLYGVSGRIFAQGGYYYVPNDVTSIEITAYWGKAVYLGNGDNYYDRVDFDYLCQKASGSSSTATLIRENCPGTAFKPAGTRPSTLGNGQTVRTGKIADVATSYIANSGTVFDNALVLVGNHQYCTGNEDVIPSRSFTIMSADFDLDNEPDYCLDLQLGMGVQRFSICPIRFDFLPVVELGLGLKKDGSTQYYSLGCYHPKGHFEVTETALIRFGQFEFSNRRTTECPLILNGGIFDQYVKGTSGAGNANNDKIPYVIIGGNLKMLSFTPGAHVNSSYSYSTRHCAVNVIGGRFESLYLSGNFNEGVTPNADNPHCYIDGGWFGHVAAAGKEGIGNPNASDPKGNVTFKINHSVIREFYGGGVMSDKKVTGNIEVTIDNSLVNKYCGGPKFGDMDPGKTVTTHATGTTFGVYYGAGNGGTNYVQYRSTDGTYYNNNGYDWGGTGDIDDYTPGAYRNTATGYQADYDMELINVSTGTFYDCAVNRTYFYAAQYAATNTGTVSNTLTDCTVKTNFYGAGLLGGVKGIVNAQGVKVGVVSELTDTQVYGSVFGAGYSADVPKVYIYDNKVPPTIDVYTGVVTPQSEGTFNVYKWSSELGSITSPVTLTPGADGVNTFNYFYTEVPLVNLGTVEGTVTLTIKGNSTIGTFLEDGTLKPKTGNVFGGGDESAVDGNITVKLQGNTHVLGDVFGGGNKGNVYGDSSVIFEEEPINVTPPDSDDPNHSQH